MVRRDENGVVFEAPLRLNNPETASIPRLDDGYRGAAVPNSYKLSRCWHDMQEEARDHPKLGTADEITGLIREGIKTGDVPVWTADLDGGVQLIDHDAFVDLCEKSIRSGTYASEYDRGRLVGRPLFIKKVDWVVFKTRVLKESGIKPRPTSNGGRAPAVKSWANKPPSEEAILAKADEMHGKGLTTREIEKLMRLEEGFADVASTEVRRIITGRYRPTGRPPKKRKAAT